MSGTDVGFASYRTLYHPRHPLSLRTTVTLVRQRSPRYPRIGRLRSTAVYGGVAAIYGCNADVNGCNDGEYRTNTAEVLTNTAELLTNTAHATQRTTTTPRKAGPNTPQS
eukprot:2177489-Rhodomonas_salina.1